MRLPSEKWFRNATIVYRRVILAIAFARALWLALGDGYSWQGQIGLSAFGILLVLLADQSLIRIIDPAADRLSAWIAPPAARFILDLLWLKPPLVAAVESARVLGCAIASVGHPNFLQPLITEYKICLSQAFSTKPIAFAEKHGAYGLHPLTQSLLFFSSGDDMYCCSS